MTHTSCGTFVKLCQLSTVEELIVSYPQGVLKGVLRMRMQCMGPMVDCDAECSICSRSLIRLRKILRRSMGPNRPPPKFGLRRYLLCAVGKRYRTAYPKTITPTRRPIAPSEPLVPDRKCDLDGFQDLPFAGELVRGPGLASDWLRRDSAPPGANPDPLELLERLKLTVYSPAVSRRTEVGEIQ